MANHTHEEDEGLANRSIILVTGTNSGLGFSICCRLVDDFLKNPTNNHRTLTVIFTTRSAQKGHETLHRLQQHLHSTTATNPKQARRITFTPETVDLSNLASTRTCARRIDRTFPKLDAVILNAGIGGWTGLNWPQAIWGVLTDLVHTVSWPAFKIAPVGQLTARQTSTLPVGEEPPLGNVFCANVFGHYMLAHHLMPLLQRCSSPSSSSSSSSDSGGSSQSRIIWVSSIEATLRHFSVTDLQGLRTKVPYESSKALTDILALTADLPATKPWTSRFYSFSPSPHNLEESEERDALPPNDTHNSNKPNIYVAHPGVCGTAILPLALPLIWAMQVAFWLARLLGSPWHTMWTYMGASAPVWLALSSQTELDAAEAPYRARGGGRVKWGSSCDRLGRDSVLSTEMDGWGHGGVVGPAVVEADRRRRRKRGARDLTAEERVAFEELGRRCWREMEELRVQWERILDREELEKKQGLEAPVKA
ncbi:3-keto-steroid reductase [Aspergillus homomorphus CBS 101889]|uniref:3-ketosteroid reductase n=1 Tax=Aspergillus homomorphus (strain CBS 101889) TaxID=1450537 RepID=A0A395IBB1_ASPHC|nr:3-ketosteroid reductase [Aspergillus homomorphus CBS 101889]RAL17512.1 3-ketosteroid reductase [Aspergillus homomorphus CBS 101889]